MTVYLKQQHGIFAADIRYSRKPGTKKSGGSGHKLLEHNYFYFLNKNMKIYACGTVIHNANIFRRRC
jgi:hypothetical protein